MGSEFSAIDAELDALGGEATVDALALAQAYAPDLPTLSAVDGELTALADDVPARLFTPTSLGDRESTGSSAVAASASPAVLPQSEEIVLPEPVSREELDAESREIPLDDPGPRSGSFELHEDVAPSELDVDATIELTPNMARRSGTSERARRGFNLAHADADYRDADSEFDALFVEATRRSSMPSAPPERHEGGDAVGDDTDIFDTSVLGFEDVEPSDGSEFAAERLDSGELEVIDEPPPSNPPEKRPSFLGRLFGRKEDGP